MSSPALWLKRYLEPYGFDRVVIESSPGSITVTVRAYHECGEQFNYGFAIDHWLRMGFSGERFLEVVAEEILFCMRGNERVQTWSRNRQTERTAPPPRRMGSPLWASAFVDFTPAQRRELQEAAYRNIAIFGTPLHSQHWSERPAGADQQELVSDRVDDANWLRRWLNNGKDEQAVVDKAVDDAVAFDYEPEID